MPIPEPLPSDWSYLLAMAFLDAAVSCEATCDRRFVSPVLNPEGLPPGCTCQLVAIVNEGYQRNKATACGMLRTATVRLVLELCVPAPGENEIPDPVAMQTAAREAATTRWLMMKGLHRAAGAGELCGMASDGWPAGTQVGCCGNLTPDVWRPTRQDHGATRWETTWTWSE